MSFRLFVSALIVLSKASLPGHVSLPGQLSLVPIQMFADLPLEAHRLLAYLAQANSVRCLHLMAEARQALMIVLHVA